MSDVIDDAIATLRHIRDDAEHRIAALERAADADDEAPVIGKDTTKWNAELAAAIRFHEDTTPEQGTPPHPIRGIDGHLHAWGRDRLIEYCLEDGCEAWRAKS